jgi:hypothetical protein
MPVSRPLRQAHTAVAPSRSAGFFPRAARVLLFVYVSLIAIPLRFHAIEPGLDPSWAFALRWFHSRGLLHGNDIGFTWGPLAHLAIAMDVGAGLAAPTVAQLGGWAIFIGVWAWVVFIAQISLWRIAAFAAATYAGSRFFHEFGYAGFDFFLSWLVLLLLGCSLRTNRWHIPFGAAVVLAGVLALMKFSTGIAAASAVLAFPVGLALIDREKATHAALMAGLGLPVLFAAGFFIHNPSAARLARYLKTGFELSSEHSTILSLPGDPRAAILAMTLLACYAAAVAVLLWRRSAALPLALATAGPLFLEFKHSFIRGPGHVDMLFLFFPLAAGILLLFVPDTGRSLAAILAVFAAVWIYAEPRVFAPTTLVSTRARLLHASPLLEVFNWANLKNRLAQQSAANLTVDVLPAELLARVGDRSITIFPWESSYAAANRLNYRPFPVFQSYDAYTPFLDRWNAEFLESTETAPEFVLFDWAAIDERHPLLDVPQMALALFSNYALEGTFGRHMLLRRLDSPRSKSPPRKVAEGSMQIGEALVLPEHSAASVLRLHLRWTRAGELKKFFWRLPEVRWIGEFGDGSSISARVPPAVLAGGVPVDLIPADVDAMSHLFSRGTGRKLRSVTIAGAGARDLQRTAPYEIWQLNDVPVEPVPALALKVSSGLRGDCRIDSVGPIGVTNRKDIVSIPAHEGFITIRGWAIIRQGPREVVLTVDDQPVRATYGVPRPDVTAVYGSAALLHSGIQHTLAAGNMGDGDHKLRVFIPDALGGYQACIETVRFRLDR